jgi:SynChlorMet cassette protein ScmD
LRSQTETMKLDAKPIANPTVVLREEFDNWAVLFNPDTADAFGVNPVGVAVWKLMDGRHTIAEAVASIQEQFANVPGSASEEIASFIEQLIEQGFLGYQTEGTE